MLIMIIIMFIKAFLKRTDILLHQDACKCPSTWFVPFFNFNSKLAPLYIFNVYFIFALKAIVSYIVFHKSSLIKIIASIYKACLFFIIFPGTRWERGSTGHRCFSSLGDSIFSLLGAWVGCWTTSQAAGDWGSHNICDVIVMIMTCDGHR